MAIARGTRLGPYEILTKLGSGGMGDVYRARDSRLQRDVAIKVLPPALAGDPNRVRRFQQEAHAVAALSHPQVCQIYDVGPDYLVLEYIDGTPLQGPVPPDRAIQLALEIVGALEAAHQRGILHRDLKPANIVVTRSGGAKLLDFGLAKLLSAETDLTQTSTGTIVGTPAYMSPEQAQGRPLDVRSDVFSLGAVLYEWLSTRRAFEGGTLAEILSAVLRDDPPLPPCPPALARVVMRCLAKIPAERFQTMAEVRAALETARDSMFAKSPATQRSIAVLPFADMSAGKDHEWFSDGLSEEIIGALAHVPGLTVIARTSAFAFKNKQEDIRRIAEVLGVSLVLEGSVRRAGDRLRITAQLVSAASGSHLWSERYDRDMADVFAIQDEIAHAIAATLEERLSAGQIARRRYTPTLPAYDAYLKARHHWAHATPESLARSKEYYEQAIDLDPGFALAYIGLADYFLLLATGMGMLSAHEAMPRARAAAQRALDLDPTLPDAHARLGAVASVYDYLRHPLISVPLSEIEVC